MGTVQDDKPVSMLLANQVLGHITPNEDGVKEVDILVIIAIIGLIIQAYQCWKNNRTDAVEACRAPSFYQYRILRLTVRRAIGWRMFIRKGDEIIEGLLAIGQNITEDEILQVITEYRIP